jgi:hypothetical protein
MLDLQNYQTYFHLLSNECEMESILQSFIERQRAFLKDKEIGSWKDINVVDEDYLVFAEDRVRQFAHFQNDQGAIIDPYDQNEREYSTASYVKAGSILLKEERCNDLKESIFKAMVWSCYCLGTNKVPDDHSDFTTHMLMKALRNLTSFASEKQIEKWKSYLRNIEPEETYTQVERNFPVEQTRNWTTYAMHGEMMRYRDKLTDYTTFIEKYLPAQLKRFTSEGLYRDPNLPAAYDLAARDQLNGLLEEGYNGIHAALLNKLLRRGAKTMLLMQSSTGEVSFGGRSNQLIWNELTFSHICESEARMYQRSGNLEWASIFKRAAHRAFYSISRWINEVEEFKLFKNSFPTEKREGWEFYAFYSTYSLYAAQIAASCYEAANHQIEEAPAPCDIGGYIVSIPSFHRIFTTSGYELGNYHLGFDTNAQMGHDATGLVRFHKKNIPSELALSVGIPTKTLEIPWYFFSARSQIPSPKYPVAIGPMWCDEHGTWHRLANYGRRNHEIFHRINEKGEPLNGERQFWKTSVEDVVHTKDSLEFSIRYFVNSDDGRKIEREEITVSGANMEETQQRALADILPRPENDSCIEIKETYCIRSEGVTITWTLTPSRSGELTAIGITVPLLVTNGKVNSQINQEANRVSVSYLDHQYIVEDQSNNPSADLRIYPGLMPNRNGYYRTAQFTSFNSDSIRLHFQLV